MILSLKCEMTIYCWEVMDNSYIHKLQIDLGYPQVFLSLTRNYTRVLLRLMYIEGKRTSLAPDIPWCLLHTYLSVSYLSVKVSISSF